MISLTIIAHGNPGSGKSRIIQGIIAYLKTLCDVEVAYLHHEGQYNTQITSMSIERIDDAKPV